jgi:hypothetical protein
VILIVLVFLPIIIPEGSLRDKASLGSFIPMLRENEFSAEQAGRRKGRGWRGGRSEGGGAGDGEEHAKIHYSFVY